MPSFKNKILIIIFCLVKINGEESLFNSFYKAIEI